MVQIEALVSVAMIGRRVGPRHARLPADHYFHSGR